MIDTFIDTDTGAFPYHYDDVRAAFPHISFPASPPEDFVPPEPYEPIIIDPIPPAEWNQQIKQAQPIRDMGTGIWSVSWQIIERSQEELGMFLGMLRQQVIDAVQKRLDDFAATRGYDGILSVCTYVADPNPEMAHEGAVAVYLRSITWQALRAIETEISLGLRQPPINGYADIESELPPLDWDVALN